MDEAERLEPGSVAAWAAWLAEHHARGHGVWLVSRRREADRAFGYEAAVLEALRVGWVDSTQRPLDEARSMMWFAPRRRESVWTRINKGRIARLEEAGLLLPAGAAAVAAAKASGMWTLMDEVEDLLVPPDLAEALSARPGATERWDAHSPSARKAALAWIVTAKRAETRGVRVTTVADRTAAGERPA